MEGEELVYDPDTLLSNKGPELIHTIIIYGSKPGDPLGDDRFGEHQRRVEIVLRPRLPRHGMTKEEIFMFARHFVGVQWSDLKHTQFWHCEICDKPCRLSQTNTVSWTHLNPPRANTYIHFACDIYSGSCAKTLREMDIAVRSLSPGIPPSPPRLMPDGTVYPLASSCAGCQKDTTSSPNLPHCGGCKLTRYCSQKCQKGEWRRHKPFCKTPKEIKWVWE